MMKYQLMLLGLLISPAGLAQQAFEVTPGDSLSYILRSQNYGDSYAEILPFIEETLRNNPQAFRNGDINQLIPGAVLILPENPNAPEPEPEPAPEPEPVVEIEPEPQPEPQPEPENPVIGSIDVTRGFSEIMRGDELVAVARRENLYSADVIVTQENTRAEIVFSDQTRFSLGSKSRFEINEYRFTGNQSLDSLPEGNLIATLQKGVFSAISGFLGQNADSSFEIRSALTSTIGIRGTEFTVRACVSETSCGDLYGVAAAVRDGAVSLRNSVSEVRLEQNEFARVKSATEAPAKEPLPEGFFDLDRDAGDIQLAKAWWQRTLDWITEVF